MLQSKAYDIVENRCQKPQRSRQGANQRAVIDPVVSLHFRFTSGASYAFEKPDRFAGLDSPIILSGRQKRRRRKRIHEIDRLFAGGTIFRPEDLFQCLALKRQEVIGARKGDHGAQLDVCIEIDAGKPFPIERQHRSKMGAGGMADDDDPAPIAPEFGDMIHRPAHRRIRIFDEAGEWDLRINPVVGSDGRKASGCQHRSNKKTVASLAFHPPP